MANEGFKLTMLHNIRDSARLYDERTRKQIPFATAVALTRTAKIGQRDVVSEMSKRFDRPTPFTLKSVYIIPAKKTKLEAQVFIKDRAPGGKQNLSLAEVLGHQFDGGARVAKRSEYRFRQIGLISNNEFLMPAEGAKLDRYGNMNRGQLQQITSQLRINLDQYSNATKSKRSVRNQRNAGRYFWSYGDFMPRGVYMRNGKGVMPVMIVIEQPIYKQRVNMRAIRDQVMERDFPREFDKAFSDASNSAGRKTSTRFEKVGRP